MKQISELEGAQIARAIQAMTAGKIVVVTTGDGARAQVMRLAIICESINNRIEDFERFDSFDTIEEAKAFLKGEPAGSGDGENAEDYPEEPDRETFIAECYYCGRNYDTGEPSANRVTLPTNRNHCGTCELPEVGEFLSDAANARRGGFLY